MIFAPWTLLLYLIGLPWTGPGLTLHVVLPGGAVYWVCYVVDGGARPDELVRSAAGYGIRCRPPRRRPRYSSKIRVVR